MTGIEKCEALEVGLGVFQVIVGILLAGLIGGNGHAVAGIIAGLIDIIAGAYLVYEGLK